jgi:hypothetical protein
VYFPQSVSGCFWQITKFNPDVGPWSTRKICSPNLLVFFWDIRPNTVWVECIFIIPLNLCGCRIDLPPGILEQLVEQFQGDRDSA